MSNKFPAAFALNDDGLVSVPPHAEREVVTIVVPPNDHQVEFMIEDGQRIIVIYGNTETAYDLTTRRYLGRSTSGDGPPTVQPKFKAGRLGPDELADINDEAHRLVYGDETTS